MLRFPCSSFGKGTPFEGGVVSALDTLVDGNLFAVRSSINASGDPIDIRFGLFFPPMSHVSRAVRESMFLGLTALAAGSTKEDLDDRA